MKKTVLLFAPLFCLLYITAGAQISFSANKKFASIELKAKEKPALGLGQQIEIGIIAMTDKGKELKTPGFLEPAMLKSVEWSSFKIEVEGGTYENGVVTISSDLAEIKNHEVKIKAVAANNAEIKNELVVKLNYKGTTTISFDGEYGRRGTRGNYGAKGANAVTSSDQAGPAGMGGSGGQGGDGGDGQHIEVYVKLQYDETFKKEMLYALIKNKETGKQQLAISDPEEGKLVVTANGGDGGTGGDGGQGGQGGDDPYRMVSTNGAAGGLGGNGGNGGNGGTITVYMDPSTDKLSATAITFSTDAGSAGRGGDGGLGGFKGSNNNAVNGPQGTRGSAGSPGTKGAAPVIKKQKVEMDLAKMAAKD